jgi:hypothetical protein
VGDSPFRDDRVAQQREENVRRGVDFVAALERLWSRITSK